MTPAEQADVARTFVLRLQSAVRSHMLHLLRIGSLTEIVEQCPSLTDEEMKMYASLSPAAVLNGGNFRIDFKRPWHNCEFNREASTVFVENFLEAVAGGSYRSPPIPSRFFTPHQVKAALDSHMPHARAIWKNGTVPPSAKSAAKRRTTKCVNTRKRTLKFQRYRSVVVYELNEHVLLISMLAPCNMSGDECKTAADALTNTWVIVEAEWQSEELKTFLRLLDKLWQVYRLKTGDSEAPADDADQTSSLGPGKAPRNRIARPGGRVVDSTAPIGLWRNCYNLKWLEKKRPHFIKGLEMIDADYDFSLDMPALLGRSFTKGPDPMDVEDDDENGDDDEDEDEDGQGQNGAEAE